MHSINAIVVFLVLVEENGRNQNGLEIIESLVTWRRVYLKYGIRNEESGNRFSKDAITYRACKAILGDVPYTKSIYALLCRSIV